MIISPPFLPESGVSAPSTTVIDPMMDAADKLELAHGIYPLAMDRRRHMGVHLSPALLNEKVRAIADGEVVAYRVCQHAIEGSPGSADSSAGFVLLRHKTETGDGRALTFYSLYMHLLEFDRFKDYGTPLSVLPPFMQVCSPGPDMHPPVAPPAQQGVPGQNVYRKDVLGLTGKCHGQRHLHFEIFMTMHDFDTYFGATQLGKTQLTTPTKPDCWGSTYYVIDETHAFLSVPVNDAMDRNNTLHGIAFPPLTDGTLPANHTLYVEAYFHLGQRCTRSWLDKGDGRPVRLTGSPVDDLTSDYEYDLYKRATSLYPTCPSDGYEMLRFGRILSTPATLQDPVSRTTWISVVFDEEGTQGYVNIAEEAIRKLSDADFPFFTGWKKLSEGEGPFDADGLCDIDSLKTLLGNVEVESAVSEGNTEGTAQANERDKEEQLIAYVTSHADVRTQLRGLVCEAPSEWDGANHEARYAKLTQPGEFYENDPKGYAAYVDVLNQFQFWDSPKSPLGEKVWFFHPLEFIRHFRKCGWLSLDEYAMTFPRHMFYTPTGNPRLAITESNPTYTIGKLEARGRIAAHAVALNKCMGKYLGNSKQRITIFLAQVLLETAQWRNLTGAKRLMHEWGFGQYSTANPATRYYGPFYGRGIMQLTWAGNYKQYGEFRSLPSNTGAYTERLPGVPPRITPTSRHYTANPSDGGHLVPWFPRYDPDSVGEEIDKACDSGGFYWVSKPFSEGINISRVSDRPYSASNIGLINRLVNGGGNGYYERQAYSLYIHMRLSDVIDGTLDPLVAPPSPKNRIRVNFDSPE